MRTDIHTAIRWALLHNLRCCHIQAGSRYEVIITPRRPGMVARQIIDVVELHIDPRLARERTEWCKGNRVTCNHHSACHITRLTIQPNTHLRQFRRIDHFIKGHNNSSICCNIRTLMRRQYSRNMRNSRIIICIGRGRKIKR